MKKILILLSLVLCVQFAHSQKNKQTKIPQAVMDKFVFTYPNSADTVAYPIKWERVKGYYKGTVQGFKAMASAVIDTAGNIVRIEKPIHIQYLPEKVKTMMNSTYKDAQVKSILQITDAKGKRFFSIVLEFQPMFDEEGNLLKTDKK